MAAGKGLRLWKSATCASSLENRLHALVFEPLARQGLCVGITDLCLIGCMRADRCARVCCARVRPVICQCMRSCLHCCAGRWRSVAVSQSVLRSCGSWWSARAAPAMRRNSQVRTLLTHSLATRNTHTHKQTHSLMHMNAHTGQVFMFSCYRQLGSDIVCT